MNFVSRTLSGGAFIFAGLGFFVAAFFSTKFFLIHAAGFIIVGTFILFNKKEDEIEKIKSGRKNK